LNAGIMIESFMTGASWPEMTAALLLPPFDSEAVVGGH
jgi:hypothetical protein